MKVLGLVLAFILSFNLLVSNVLAADETDAETVDVYAVFWPIVPGRTVNDSMYFVKQFKEGFGEMFSFGDIKKSEYQMTLAEKRLVEAYKLYTEDKNYSAALKTLEMNEANRKKALEYLTKAKESKRDVGELRIKLVSSLENQETVFKQLVNMVPDDQKSKIEETLKQLTLQISEAR